MRTPRSLSLAAAVVTATLSLAATAPRAAEFSLGAKLGIGDWKVTDNDGSTSAVGKGSMLNIHAALQWNKAYAGLGLSGGTFDFGDHAPRQPTNPSNSTQSGEIKRGEFDLVFGYYFWQDYSLFWALKSAGEEWQDGYKLDIGGLGMGVAANHALSPRWSLLWRAGLMSLTAKYDNNEIGKGGAVALEFGAVFRAAEATTLNAGLKVQAQELNYDNDVRQKHATSLLGAGVNHAF